MSKSAKVEFYVGASLSRVQRSNEAKKIPQIGGGQRGRITKFSSSSRRRLLRQVAKIKRDEDTLFITLTYPDIFPDDPLRWKRDLKTLAARIERQWPTPSFIWRLELQQRKSGQQKGKIAPHYHLFLYGISSEDEFDLNEFQQWLSLSWFQIVESQDEKHLRAGTNCTFMRSWKGSMAYAAKYMTKFNEVDDLDIGRHWGVYFRKNLPEAEVIELELTDEQAIRIIRMYRKHSNIKVRSYKSLSVFFDASQWLDGISKLYDIDYPQQTDTE